MVNDNLHHLCYFLGRALDVALCKEEVGQVKLLIAKFREDVDKYHATWYAACMDLASELGIEPSVPRWSSRNKNRPNPPSASPSEYYKLTITVPMLGEHYGNSKWVWCLLDLHCSNIVTNTNCYSL